jgi:potassium-dependent mechanosensitive channel
VVLWETTVKIGETTDAVGKVIPQTRVEPVTLSNAVAAVVALMMMIVTARNAPGLLKIAVLQRVGMDRGIQFAITALSRYTIVVVGLVIAFGQIGINWSKVQWLVAAMTVGLGFGLQEIFANFVSGVIILFERPMRVGDIVTTGDITGKISQIQIRATTIQTWDNKELVVPNKEFVTGRLMNWTLTDPELRISFPIGVAYGSDTAKVERTLYSVARQHPDVLKDPEPTVTFMNFGASALDFDLRVSIPNLDVLMKVRHEINTAIDQAFRKAGIEIPFPQQDVHVRTIAAGLPVEMRKTN